MGLLQSRLCVCVYVSLCARERCVPLVRSNDGIIFLEPHAFSQSNTNPCPSPTHTSASENPIFLLSEVGELLFEILWMSLSSRARAVMCCEETLGSNSNKMFADVGVFYESRQPSHWLITNLYCFFCTDIT